MSDIERRSSLCRTGGSSLSNLICETFAHSIRNKELKRQLNEISSIGDVFWEDCRDAYNQ